MINEFTVINKQTNKTLLLSKLKDKTPYILDTVDWGQPEIEINTYSVPYQVGLSLSGISIKDRDINIIGYVVSDVEPTLGIEWSEYIENQRKDVEEKQWELSRFFMPTQDVRIYVGNYFVDARPTEIIKYSTEEKENNEILCLFSLNLKCFSPMFRLEKGKQTILAQVKQMWRFPWVLKEHGNIFGVISSQKLVEVKNNGDCDIGAVIRFEARNGTIKNPEIFNVTTGEFFKVAVTLDAGDYLIINTNIGEESVVLHDSRYENSLDSRDLNVISYVEMGSTFLQIKQGSHLLGYNVEEGGEVFVSLSVNIDEQFFYLKGM